MVDFKLMKHGERKDYVYRCGKCGTETVFVCRLPPDCLIDSEPRGLGNGVAVRRCGGRYEFVREQDRA